MKEVTENAISDLVTPELFGAYIGKTEGAVRRMAQDGKLPVIRMRDPSKPASKGEVYILRSEWDKYAQHLAREADADWHGWKDRLSTDKPQWNPNKEGKNKKGGEE